jgi:hypothetical protein
MPQKPFDIPQQLRRLAEENVEQARKLYLQFMDGLTEAMSGWAPSSPTFHELREQAVEFAKQNADAAFALARDVSQANDLRELLNLQTQYVQSQMRWYANQTQEFGGLMLKTAGSMKNVQYLQPNAGSAQSESSGEADTTKTNLKLIGFSIEVDIDPVTLKLETDKGSFSLEIPRDQLSKLAYALRFVEYAQEPLEKKRLKKQTDASKGKS